MNRNPCPHCGLIFKKIKDFGLRYDNKVRQSWCYNCRLEGLKK